jgi:hypothetical protein
MNPFAERSSKHSTWPVILTIYNLPSWLMQKRKYILLTMLISGPTQPRVDMDVFLEPLMEHMKILWVTCRCFGSDRTPGVAPQGVFRSRTVLTTVAKWFVPVARGTADNAYRFGPLRDA